MKKKLTISLLFIVSILMLDSSCTKTQGIPECIYFDTTVNINFIIQVQNATFWHHVNINSFIYECGNNNSRRGSVFDRMSGSSIVFSSQGDTSHINICSDTLHYNLPIKLSKTKPVDIFITLETPYSGGVTSMFQDILFTYSPSLKKMTSKIYPYGTSPYGGLAALTSSPNKNTSLCPNTGFSVTCKPGVWNIYVKCE